MLPFIAGIAAGALAVVAVNNKKEIKEKVVQGATKVKEKATDVKKTITNKVDSLKTKDEPTVTEKIEEVVTNVE